MSQYGSYYNNSGGGGGGGGYMPQSQSPFGGAGSPGGGQRSELSAALRPMSIAQLLKASQAHSEAEWRLDDVEIGQVTVVAHLTSIQQQATNSVYGLNDGTGDIEARQWLNNETGVQDNIKEHRYVRVTGALKSFNSKRYINCTHIRPVSADEIDFHQVECPVVTLCLERGTPTAGGASKQKDVVMGDASAYNATSTAASDQYSHLPQLQRAIVKFLQDNVTTEEGVHVSAIARAVGSGSDAVKISEALDALMDGGHVYTTSDESHFVLA